MNDILYVVCTLSKIDCDDTSNLNVQLQESSLLCDVKCLKKTTEGDGVGYFVVVDRLDG